MAAGIRTLGDGRITLVALAGDKKPAKPKEPTVAELNAGLRLEMYVMKGDYKLGSKGSTSVEEPVLGAAGKGTVPGPAEYEGQLSVYWYFDESGKKVAGGENAAWELLKKTNQEFELYEREGKKPDMPFAAGDEVDWYHVAPGQPQKPDDRTTYTKRTIGLFISDALENTIKLDEGDPTGVPTITSIDPTGKAAGDKVTISGTNFQKVTRVTFTANAATTDAASYTVKSPTVIEAVLPAGAHTGNAIVTNSLGPSIGFRYLAAS